MSKQYVLLQKVTVKPQQNAIADSKNAIADSKNAIADSKNAIADLDVSIDDIRSCAYIESISMDGVKLILEISDRVSTYRDDYNIKELTELEVTFADPGGRGDEVWIETFVVQKARTESGLLLVDLFGKTTHELKQPALVPTFFTAMQPKAILQKLLPGLTVDADSFEKGATYHLNAGGTKARLIRNMARDFGAYCFVCRGVVYFKAIKNMDMSEKFKLECGDPNAETSFSHFTILGEKELYDRVLNKNYISWDTVNGMEQGNSATTGATTLVSVNQTKASITNKPI